MGNTCLDILDRNFHGHPAVKTTLSLQGSINSISGQGSKIPTCCVVWPENTYIFFFPLGKVFVFLLLNSNNSLYILDTNLYQKHVL